MSKEYFHNKNPAGPAISEAEAIRRATSSLEACSGNMQELVFERADEGNLQNPPQAAAHFWLVAWRRQAQGVRFKDQHAKVTLDAETGRVRILSWNFATPPPRPAAFNVPREAARGKALERLKADGIEVAGLGTVEAQIVQPNTFWQVRGGERARLSGKSAHAQLAWVCRVPKAEEGSYSEVWLDVQSGEIIGGDLAVRAGPRPNKSPHGRPSAAASTAGVRFSSQAAGRNQVTPSHKHKLLTSAGALREALRDAEEIHYHDEIYRAPVDVTLSERSHPDIFRLLKNKTNVHWDQGWFNMPGRLIIRVKGSRSATRGQTYEVTYVALQGTIFVSPREHGTVHPRVKQFLLQRYQAVSAANRPPDTAAGLSRASGQNAGNAESGMLGFRPASLRLFGLLALPLLLLFAVLVRRRSAPAQATPRADIAKPSTRAS